MEGNQVISGVGIWAWHHTGLAVADLSQALKFYEGLGFTPVFEAMDMTDLIQSVTGVPGLHADLVQCKASFSDQVLELIQFRNLPADFDDAVPITPGRAHTAYLVPEIDRAIAELVAAGGRLLGQITEFSEGRAAYLTDGAGNALELEEAKGQVFS